MPRQADAPLRTAAGRSPTTRRRGASVPCSTPPRVRSAPWNRSYSSAAARLAASLSSMVPDPPGRWGRLSLGCPPVVLLCARSFGRSRRDTLGSPADRRRGLARGGLVGALGFEHLARRATDGVAEALLRSLGAPLGPEAFHGLRLLARVALDVEALGPRRPWLADPCRALRRSCRKRRLALERDRRRLP